MKNQLKFPFFMKVCLIGTLGTISCTLDCAYGGTSPDGVRVVSVNGLVRVENRPIRAGEVITPGSVIRTGVGAGIKILLADQSILDLGAETQFRVESFAKMPDGERQVKLKLDSGSLRALVSKKLNSKSTFTIRTKSSVLAVRGTEFSVNIDAEGERVTVSEGNVLRSSLMEGGKTVELTQGKQLVAKFSPEGARGVASETGSTIETKLATLSPDEARKEVGSNVVEDKTFIKNVDISRSSEGMETGLEGNSTLTSVAIASGAEERPRDPKERGEKGDNLAENGKRAKAEKVEGKDANEKNLPPPSNVGGPPSGPGQGPGNLPTVPPINANDTIITAKIKMSVN